MSVMREWTFQTPLGLWNHNVYCSLASLPFYVESRSSHPVTRLFLAWYYIMWVSGWQLILIWIYIKMITREVLFSCYHFFVWMYKSIRGIGNLYSKKGTSSVFSCSFYFFLLQYRKSKGGDVYEVAFRKDLRRQKTRNYACISLWWNSKYAQKSEWDFNDFLLEKLV